MHAQLTGRVMGFESIVKGKEVYYLCLEATQHSHHALGSQQSNYPQRRIAFSIGRRAHEAIRAGVVGLTCETGEARSVCAGSSSLGGQPPCPYASYDTGMGTKNTPLTGAIFSS